MTFADLPSRPNILIIITDQEREVMHWPEGWAEANLQARNRLLAHGMQFTRAQCNASACSASRATSLTGRYPSEHGVKNLVSSDDPKSEVQRHIPVLPSRLPNLATTLAKVGYNVVLKGKLHVTRPVRYNAEMKRYYWSDADKDHLANRYGFKGWNPPDMSDPMSLNDGGGGTINNDGRFVDGTGTAAGHDRPRAEMYEESAVNFLNTYKEPEPFCLIVALVNPHDVQEYPGRGIRAIQGRRTKPTYAQVGYKLEEFKDVGIGLPASVDDDLKTKPKIHAAFRRFLGIATGHVRTKERQLIYANLYAYLHKKVDGEIAKVLDALDANGHTDNTLIIRTSDHGELGMAHGRGRQKFYNAYREALSVPLIFSNPRMYPEPKQTDSLASLIDVLPTLATIAGVPDRETYGFKGRDLTPILADPAVTVQDALHFAYEDDVFPVSGARFIRAIIEGNWKYAVYYDPYGGAPMEFELYDLAADPLEMTNLAHPKHRTAESDAERARLHGRLIDLMKKNLTLPDEIEWPGVEDFAPSASLADTTEAEEDDETLVGST